MDLPSLDGVEWRPATPVDGAVLAALWNESADADGVPERVSADYMAHELASPNARPAERTIAAIDAAGRALAWAAVYIRDNPGGEHRAYLDALVTPALRDGTVAEALTDWVVTTAEHELRAIPGDHPKHLMAWRYDFVTDDIERLRRRGFEEVRQSFEMDRDLAAPIPDPPDLDPVALVPWEPRHHEPAMHARNDAFANHWGSTPVTRETWMHDVIGEPHLRLDLSFVAEADGEVVGYALNYVYPDDFGPAGRTEGWIGSLGVKGPWRRRGIARALLLTSLRAMRDDGLEFGMLGVDTANATGALRLYEDTGFQVRHRQVALQKTLT